MRASLEKKVQGMRSQTMTFANDGIELSLNVPDSADVRETFGTMVDTVVEQHDEIGRLNTHIDKVEHDNKAARKKLVDATTQRLQQLLDHQLKLETQLKAAQVEIKNFAYNIQGYVDENEDVIAPQSKAHVKVLQGIALNVEDDDDTSVRSGTTATLYPTEHGAPIESIGFRTVTTDAKPRKKKKDLSSMIYYKSIKKVSLPDDPKGRWRWAYKRVLQSIRLKQNKIGLSRTRIDKSQTLIERINRMDSELCSMPGHIENRLKASMEALLGEVGTKIQAVQDQVAEIDRQAKERENLTFQKFQTLENLVQNLDKRFTSALATMEEKQTKMESTLLNTINELRNQVKDSIALDLDRLRLGLGDITEELANLDRTVQTSLTDLKALILSEDDIAKMTPEQALDQVIENNSAIQLFRSTVAVAEASSDILQRTIHSLKRDVGAAFSHYSQKFLGNHSLVSRTESARLEEILMRSKSSDGFLKVVRDTLTVMKALLKKHDHDFSTLSQKVNGQASEATRSFPSLKADMDALHQLAHGTEQRLESTVHDVEHLQQSVTTLEQHDALFMERYQDESRSQSLATDIVKEVGTIKIQMDAVRTLLFEKSRPGSSHQGEAAVAAAMAAAGSAAIEPPQLGGEAIHGLLPQEMKTMQFTDDDPLSPGPVRAPSAGGPTGISRQSLTDAIVSILRQMLPDLLAEGGSGAGVSVLGEQRVGSPPVGHAHEEVESPSEIARRRIASRGMRPKVEMDPAAGSRPDSSAGADGKPSSPGGGNSGEGPISITSAIRQVQQVFSGEHEGGKPGSAGMNAVGSPIAGAGVTPGMKITVRSKSSMDGVGGSFSASHSPAHGHRGARSRVGGLRGSFDALGVAGVGSRVGSFAAADFPVPAFDPTPLLNDMAALRAEVMHTRRKIELIDEEKVTKSIVEKLCAEAMNEQKRRDARTDYRSMIEDADKSIRELVSEIIYLKRNQEASAQLMREEMTRTMESTVQDALLSVTDSLKESVVSTKGMCLGCGRASSVRAEPQRQGSPPPFFPHLSTGSLPGPDVLKGGFKMPVRASSPPPPTLVPLMASAGDKDIPLLLRGKVQFDPKSGRHNYGGGDLSPEVNPIATPMGSATGFTDNELLEDSESSMPMATAGDGKSQGRPRSSGEERGRGALNAASEGLRPIFRKGFPAKKSLRAEMNFAPERFDLNSAPGSSRVNLQGLQQLPLMSQSLSSFAPPPQH